MSVTLIVCILIGVIAGILGQRGRQGPAQALPPGMPEEQIMALLAQGRKIEAIKIYRETTRVGLKESKDAVELAQRTGRISMTPAAAWPPSPMSGAPMRNVSGDVVQDLIRQGKMIEAIKAYREATGSSLKEAKDAVERMAGR